MLIPNIAMKVYFLLKKMKKMKIEKMQKKKWVAV